MSRVTSATSRRAAALAALLALLLGALAAVAPAAAAKATLRVVKLSPLTIRGTGFKPAERVTLTLSAGANGTARGTATAGGAVTVSFPKAKLTACTAYTLRAVGAAGTKATFKRTVTASCKPAAALKFTGTDVLLAGTHFRPGEKLSITLVEGGGPHKRSATASSAGAFTVDFGALPMSDCTAYTLTITGSLGSRFSKSQEALPC
ncbi:MAG TPA: hypothetical protein VH305_04460 [Gaiella sp.]|jgi:hypothetical protein